MSITVDQINLVVTQLQGYSRIPAAFDRDFVLAVYDKLKENHVSQTVAKSGLSANYTGLVIVLGFARAEEVYNAIAGSTNATAKAFLRLLDDWTTPLMTDSVEFQALLNRLRVLTLITSSDVAAFQRPKTNEEVIGVSVKPYDIAETLFQANLWTRPVLTVGE